MDQDSKETQVDAFISRWEPSGGAERSNYALFLSELCDILDVDRPEPSTTTNADNAYVIDRAFTHTDKTGKSSTVYLDLYKRGHFVLETKQGSSDDGDKKGHGKRGTSSWDKALDKAYGQAKDYILDIPADEGRPPFLIVCDVGYLFDIYAEFSGTGGNYLRFPTPKHYRITLDDLRKEESRTLLRTIWTDPHSLDPSKYSAKVTREVADTLAQLATSLEKNKHDPEIIAKFLQRLLFTLFAEDVGLLPHKSFERLLEQATKSPQGFTTLITQLWREMADGASFSTIIMEEVAHFNGGLFQNPTALPLELEQIELLLHAAKQDWKEVEPAIFGTLLERALDPRERHKLGAHYTPRAYVERLIDPTLMQPLREQWAAVKTAAGMHHDADNDDKARQEIEIFHKHLTHIKVLDPACGSGNFLYVALARIKELEAEVLDLLEALGGNRMLEMDSTKVRPSQFLGIEINSNAAAIAQLVLWIGYFQWHHKTTGSADTNDRPLLQDRHTIENRDAILDYDEHIPRTDPDTGDILTIWNGITTKPHPVTGKEVPDETARKPLFDFINPRRTTWPEADYIIGNPPFLGASRMRDGLGDGYTEALRLAWKKFKPNSWDFVMFWWHQAAELVRDGKVEQFGLITTNSIHQTFNRRCIEPFLANDKEPISIIFAIPDHPWIDSAECATVRIAMSSAAKGQKNGILSKVIAENENENGEHNVTLTSTNNVISNKLTVGANVTKTHELTSNEHLSSRGMSLHGKGFFVERNESTKSLLASSIVFPFIGSTDVVQRNRKRLVIDAFGLNEKELRENHPSVYQHIYNEVKPERDQNNRPSYRDNWWIFGEPRSKLRPAINNISTYIVTPRTAKHRIFTSFDKSSVPESELVCIALEKQHFISLLSTSIHSFWTQKQAGTLGASPRYNHSRCFNTFPFPDLDYKPALKTRLTELGEQLDSLRKARQAEHAELTLTAIYNVLEKLRIGEPLTDKEKVIHDQGLVTLLMQIHDDIDQATYEAYGWSDIWQWRQDCLTGNCYDPEDNTTTQLEIAPDETIHSATTEYQEKYDQVLLQRLVDLNHQRAAEEAKGKIRYLRPDYQDPENTRGTQQEKTQELALPAADIAKDIAASKVKAKTAKLKWPKELPKQVEAVLSLIPDLGTDAEQISSIFGRKSTKRTTEVSQIITMLKSLGQIN